MQSSMRISHGSKDISFHCWVTPIIITSKPMFATYRVKVEGIISEVLTVVLRESRGWKLCTLQVWVYFPNFLLVIEICLCIPVQTAYCERGNSCLHRIMCDFQSTLGVSLLWKHSCAFLLMVLFLQSIIDRMKITELRSCAHKSERIFVHFTVTNACVWLVKNLFWLVDHTYH